MDNDLQRRRIARSRCTALSRSAALAPALVALVAVSPATATGLATATGAARPSAAPARPSAAPAQGLTHAFAVGMPARSSGAVGYFAPSGSAQVLTPSSAGLPGNGFPIRFGAAVAAIDLDRDGSLDLAVGTPGDASNRIGGRVDLLFAGGTGFSADRTLAIASPGGPGDDFGAAIAVSIPNPYDTEAAQNPTGTRNLWIGAPATTVNGHADAGAVYRYELSSSGQVALVDTITQDSALVPGAAETGDRFGELLAPSGGDVIVGVSHEDIGSATDAGAVQRLRVAPTEQGETPQTTPLIAAWSWNQNSPGAPGVAEAGDRFGAAVTSGGPIGVPGEDLGRRKDAGAVQGFSRKATASGQRLLGPLITQDSSGIPGIAEAGDRFGASVTFGTYDCFQDSRVVIGAPGEDLGRKVDAGSVTLLGGGACSTMVVSQGDGLKGAAEAGDRVGATLETLTGDLQLEDSRHDDLLIGAPGEDITAGGKTFRDTGRVLVWGNARTPAKIFGSPSGDKAGLRFGSVLSSELG